MNNEINKSICYKKLINKTNIIFIMKNTLVILSWNIFLKYFFSRIAV